MSDSDNKIDKIFNKSFEDFETSPSEGAWDNIKNKLDKDDRTDEIFNKSLKNYEVTPSNRVWGNVEKELGKEYYKRKAVWFQRIAAGLFLFMMVIGAYIWINIPEDKKIITEKNQSPPINNKEFIKTYTKDDIQKPHNTEPSTLSNIKSEEIINSNSNDKYDAIKTKIKKQSKAIPPNVYQKENEFINSSIKDDAQATIENKDEKVVQNNISESKNKDVATIIDNAKIVDTPIANKESVISVLESGNKDSVAVSENKNTIDKQPELENIEKSSKWVIGIIGSPDYSFRKLSASKTTPSSNSTDDIGKLNHDEKGKYTYTAGLKSSYKYNDKWQVNIGLQYSTKGFITNTFKIDSVPQSKNYTMTVLGSSGSYTSSTVSSVPVVGDSIGRSSKGYTIYRYNYYLNQKIEYFEIPFTLQYSLKSWNKLSMNVSAGASLNYFYKSKTEAHFSNSDRDYIATPSVAYKRIHYTALFNIGIDYRLSKNLHLEIAATYRRAITPMNKNSTINVFLYSAGIITGVSYHF